MSCFIAPIRGLAPGLEPAIVRDTLKESVDAIERAIVLVEALTKPQCNVPETFTAIFVELDRSGRTLNAFLAIEESQNLSQALEHIKTARDSLASNEVGAALKAHEALESAEGCVRSEMIEELNGPS